MNDILGTFGTFLAMVFFVWVMDGNKKAALRRKYQNITVFATCEKCRHTYSVPDPWVDDERFFPRKRICPTCTAKGASGQVVTHHHNSSATPPANKWSALTAIAAINGGLALVAVLIPSATSVAFGIFGMEFALAFLLMFRKAMSRTMEGK